jgi:hypothetical protein
MEQLADKRVRVLTSCERQEIAQRAALKQASCERREIAHRRSELGWRAAVLDERASRHAFRLRASEEGSG